MSHNITLAGVKLTDMNMLDNAVTQLSNGRARLDMDAKSFRTWPGQPTHCDAKIAMPGRHDIGLKKNSDGSYTPVFDPYRMDDVFNAGGKNKIGGLLREIGMQQAEYEAAQSGYSTERVPGENGVITLSLVKAT